MLNHIFGRVDDGLRCVQPITIIEFHQPQVLTPASTIWEPDCWLNWGMVQRTVWRHAGSFADRCDLDYPNTGIFSFYFFYRRTGRGFRI